MGKRAMSRVREGIVECDPVRGLQIPRLASESLALKYPSVLGKALPSTQAGIEDRPTRDPKTNVCAAGKEVIGWQPGDKRRRCYVHHGTEPDGLESGKVWIQHNENWGNSVVITYRP